ncbi:MAG: tRNA (adenosine(37)-N6)-threonylcarbamoyltransferase complex ATPase subunit type 1 TsaE [Steroidobacteraceae bacterium]
MGAIGAGFARGLPALDTAPLLLYLTGGLGAGKTTLARGLLTALGVAGPIRSPTYTLVEVHALPRLVVVHADLYRLTDPEELEPLGLRELHAPAHLWVVEWPERVAGVLPTPDLHLRLSIEAAAHTVQVEAASDRGYAWLRGSLEIPDLSP